jgi:hypothetical protein
MDQTHTIQLTDETIFPDRSVLEAVLGESYKAYESLLRIFDAEDMIHEWRYYKDGKSWLCKVQKKAKTVVWMSAWKGYLKAAIYLPEKHLDELNRLPISSKTRDSIRSAKNVGKSRPCVFEIRDDSVLRDFETVMDFKRKAK